MSVVYTSPFELRPRWEGLHADIEHWRPVRGYEGFYAVSHFGRVASLSRIIIGADGRKQRLFGRILQPTLWDPDKPYPGVTLCVAQVRRRFSVHGLVGEAFCGPKPEGWIWRHFDDDKSNCRASNIIAGTDQDNADDAKRNGRLPSGEACHLSKLSEREASAIRALFGVVSRDRLADRFGTHISNIGNIQLAKTWKIAAAISEEDALKIFNDRSEELLVPHYEPAISLADVKHQLRMHGRAGAIYYSGSSCWWSHHYSHSQINGPAMKCPMGGQIYRELDWEAWIEAAESNPGYYGAHGLDALIVAHHSNCRHPQTGGPFAASTWAPYNAAIDAMLEEEKGLRKTAALRV